MCSKPDDPPKERAHSFTMGETDFKAYLHQPATQDASVQAGESSASPKATQEGQLAHSPTGRAEAPAVRRRVRHPATGQAKALGVQLSKAEDTPADCEIPTAADGGGDKKLSVPQEAARERSLVQILLESEMSDNEKNASLEAQIKDSP